MSIVSDARRAAVQVCFGGVDVTRDIRPYLLSLTWTDNEEDEADDLQIKLQDRDGIWLTKWLTSTERRRRRPRMAKTPPPQHTG